MNKPDDILESEFDIPGIFRHYNPYRIKGNYEIYTQEFAYSVIYGNLRQENIDKIMKLLKLDKLPRILFLIRVDGCNDIYKTFPEYKVYPLKLNIVNKLQKILSEKAIQGVVASFIGRDTIGVFLCLEGASIEEPEIRENLSDVARTLIDYIKLHTGECISIGISEFCNDLSRFTKAYSECQEAFYKNFQLGNGTFAFYSQEELNKVLLNKEDVELYTSKITFYMDALNNEGFIKSIDDMMKYLSAINISSVDIRLHMVKVINHISDYYLKNGLEKETVDLLSLNAMKDILNSKCIISIEKAIKLFCEGIHSNLIVLHQSSDDRIRIFVEDCFKKFYDDSDFNLARASDICHYSPYHFGRLFKQVFGTSFNQCLNNYRIEKSKDMLQQTQLSVEDIAWKVGFSSVSYFCTVFKRTTGMTPRQYVEREIMK